MKWESRQKEVQEGDRDLSGKAGGADSLWPVVLGRGGVGGGAPCPSHLRGHSARLRDTLDCHTWGVGRDAVVSRD